MQGNDLQLWSGTCLYWCKMLYVRLPISLILQNNMASELKVFTDLKKRPTLSLYLHFLAVWNQTFYLLIHYSKMSTLAYQKKADISAWPVTMHHVQRWLI